MISIEYIEDDSVKYNGEIWKAPIPRRGVLPQFARYLLSCGVAPETLLSATRGTTAVWESGITVGSWAAISIQETDIPIKMKKYVPFDKHAFDN